MEAAAVATAAALAARREAVALPLRRLCLPRLLHPPFRPPLLLARPPFLPLLFPPRTVVPLTASATPSRRAERRVFDAPPSEHSDGDPEDAGAATRNVRFLDIPYLRG